MMRCLGESHGGGRGWCTWKERWGMYRRESGRVLMFKTEARNGWNRSPGFDEYIYKTAFGMGFETTQAVTATSRHHLDIYFDNDSIY